MTGNESETGIRRDLMPSRPPFQPTWNLLSLTLNSTPFDSMVVFTWKIFFYTCFLADLKSFSAKNTIQHWASTVLEIDADTADNTPPTVVPSIEPNCWNFFFILVFSNLILGRNGRIIYSLFDYFPLIFRKLKLI